MNLTSVLVANRGEIAVRVLRAASELGLRTVTPFSSDDSGSLHVRRADEAVELPGTGPPAYLDAEQLIAAARRTRCDALHPGYGFLSESAAFARRCTAEGITFVGPAPETLELFGDKAAARAQAERIGVPVPDGTAHATDIDEATQLLATHGAIVIKAIAGGGGRGMRVVREPSALAEAYERCRSESRRAFGNDRVYVERFVPGARHVEVQVAGDGSRVVHLWERDCSIQRRHQKLVEIAPAPALDGSPRDKLLEAAVRLAESVNYHNVGTFEFLVHGDEFSFIEANPRLQVEHTVTEEVTGVDLVQLQLWLAGGRPLDDLGLADEPPPPPRGCAIELRVNAETMTPDGSSHPSSGTITGLELPADVRVDTATERGMTINPRFDPLLAKLVCHSPEGFPDATARAIAALEAFRIEGVDTNAAFLLAVLRHPAFAAAQFHTGFVDEHLGELVPRRPVVGAGLDPGDPLAVLEHGRSSEPLRRQGPAAGIDPPAEVPEAPAGTIPVEAPMQGTIVAVSASPGQEIAEGAQLFVLESMKMEHVVQAPASGIVRMVVVSPGDTVPEGYALAFLEETTVEAPTAAEADARDLDEIRPDLAEVLERHRIGLDEARPDAVARRRKIGQRTARENIEDLCDPGSFIEYGPLVIAAQRRRREVEDLIERTPADGLICGIGRVNGDEFGERRSRCVVLSYDYTVLAGTQGHQNHRKKDRMFEIAEKQRLPLVFFTEGGGGRPGDTDAPGVAGLDVMAFHLFGRLSGLVPLVGINSGRCFAGNAALLGCCDVVIATENSTIGMGGPAMIEGGGLGVYRPEEVGPMDVQVPNGVVDLPVADEAEAVQVAKQYLSYFQGSLPHSDCVDQRLLRTLIPENRLRVYDVREVIATLADSGSVLELRRAFGPGMVTALARVEGHPIGVVANNPAHLAGAITSDGADKASRFMQLCDAFDIPILFLCDTPGIMVGPEAEKTALVRHASRMFVTGASLTVPFFTIILRKAYGLGAQAMAGGSFKAPLFTVTWPTGEFGGMGLEGAVKLGYRKELAAIDDPEERKRLFEEMVERAYEHGKALNAATYFEFDDVIDPTDSRRWITTALDSAPPPAPRHGKKRPCIDTW